MPIYANVTARDREVRILRAQTAQTSEVENDRNGTMGDFKWH